MKMITLESLRTMPGRTPRSFSGYIPVDYFVKNEAEIRFLMRSIGPARVWFRGPRAPGRARPSATLRRDATHAVIYRV
jgi:hypothetical protein